MRIDSHQHFWRYRPEAYPWIDEGKAVLKRDYLPEDLAPLLSAQGFDGCVAVQAAHTPDETRFVLDHIAKSEIEAGRISPWKELVRELAAAPNVCCKLSGIVTEAAWKGWTAADFRPYLDVVFEAFGPDRLMIGSDWPVCLLAGDYGTVMGLVEDYMAGRPAADRERVLGANAARFYGISIG